MAMKLPRTPERSRLLSAFLSAGLLLASLGAAPARSQEIEPELAPRARLFPDVGPGLKALKRDAAGRYYVLSAPGPAVAVYSPAGKRVGQIPRDAVGPAAIVYGEDFDLDASGSIYVADRGANAIKIYSPSGQLTQTIPIAAPTSVAVLPAGEIAVASLKSNRLVTVFDAAGKVVRQFGDLSDLAEHAELNRFLNIGRLASDPASDIYYAFTYLPEPTVRKYNRYGYAAYEISLATLEFEPRAQAERRDIFRLDQHNSPPELQKVINAIAVDPATQEVWVALGDDLIHFDRDGNKRAEYRTLAPDGSDLNATAILVEPRQLLLADDPQGVFEFARPDLPAPGKVKP